MNILHVNMSLNRVSGGGTVERVIQVHKALVELGSQSHILTINDCRKGSEKLSEKDATYLPCVNTRWYVPYPEWSTVSKLVKQADVIHLMNHWTILNAWVYFLARKYKKPYLFCPAGALMVFGRSKWQKYLYQKVVGRNIVKNAAKAIAISRDEIQVMAEAGLQENRVVHIENGVNEDDFSYCETVLFREALDIGHSPYILFVGRLKEIKGPDMLLEAFPSTKERC